MGRLIYGSEFSIVIPDRALRHLQIATGIKLRRGEPFFFTWRVHTVGEGRETIWIHPALPLHFVIDDANVADEINQDWITQLLDAASSPAGLFLSREPGPRGTVSDTGRGDPSSPPLG
ncbi:hypothetical protein ITJ57_01825 [Plantibacter sp. VKM Ac-2880]|uniref:DUF7882 family protein n=1 Tax=Plantibacter sp. VKM Ac-2880 TaxID=2783827 RepID=UPI00188F500C|nr:hypothetical protein [Plantibacter sp. VKM Ac-2880]MBF4567490.1 hypothetical protein [Plantibacter sp. VKM Ac-2880]